jgi:DNA polymerase-3 subunit delta'
MSFNDIQGHDSVKLFFKKSLRDGTLSHAYLFSGPDGVGKALFAHTLSKALNCRTKEDDCCDACAACAKIENRNHPDVAWLEPKAKKEGSKTGEKLISIESVREMQGKAALKPYEGNKKIFILQDCHAMKPETADCLLKTLEEPPLDSIIILTTSKPDELALTVRSRCKTIKFPPLGLDLRVSLSQKQGLAKAEALFLAKLANSGAVFIKSDGERKAPEAILDYKNRILDEFNSGAALLEESSFIFKEGKEAIIFGLSVLGAWFRDIFLLKAGADQEFVINSDRIAELGKARDRFSDEQLENVLKEIQDAIYYVDRNVGPKLALNNLKIRIGEIIAS